MTARIHWKYTFYAYVAGYNYFEFTPLMLSLLEHVE